MYVVQYHLDRLCLLFLLNRSKASRTGIVIASLGKLDNLIIVLPTYGIGGCQVEHLLSVMAKLPGLVFALNNRRLLIAKASRKKRKQENMAEKKPTIHLEKVFVLNITLYPALCWTVLDGAGRAGSAFSIQLFSTILKRAG